ncbi:hypothetical protein A2U01_0104474, partial [Trifolium medium]|nr:hypothetical protein [Trifolium medium]
DKGNASTGQGIGNQDEAVVGSEAEGNAIGTEGNANIGQGIGTQSEAVHGTEAGIGTQSETVHGTEAEGQGIGT